MRIMSAGGLTPFSSTMREWMRRAACGDLWGVLSELNATAERPDLDEQALQEGLRTMLVELGSAQQAFEDYSTGLERSVETYMDEVEAERDRAREAERRAIEASQSKSRFLASMSHELRKS